MSQFLAHGVFINIRELLLMNNRICLSLTTCTALLALGGCASAPKYKYGATPATSQSVLVAKTGGASIPRLVSKRKNIVMAEPRAIACDGANQFAFNVVFANRQDEALDIGPGNFQVHYMGRTFPAMSEEDVNKVIHHDDWVKNSMLAVGIVGAIAGAAVGNFAGASSLLAQAGTNYATLDAQQNAEFEKYRNKVLAKKAIQPKETYGGLVIAKRDQAGKDYVFQASNVSSDIELQVDVDGETDTLSFNCRGAMPTPLPAALPPTTASTGTRPAG
jgi:hypothetical protein